MYAVQRIPFLWKTEDLRHKLVRAFAIFIWWAVHFTNYYFAFACLLQFYLFSIICFILVSIFAFFASTFIVTPQFALSRALENGFELFFYFFIFSFACQLIAITCQRCKCLGGNVGVYFSAYSLLNKYAYKKNNDEYPFQYKNKVHFAKL